MTTDMFHPTASDLSTIDRQSISASGATDMKQQISTFASLELGDNSSDDGEQLNTPVSESGQLIEIALVCGVQESFDGGNDTDSFPHSVDVSLDTHSSPTDYSTPNKQRPSGGSLSQEVSVSSESPFSPSSISVSLPGSSDIMKTRMSLGESSLDLYPSAVLSSPSSHIYSSPSSISASSVSSSVNSRPSQRLILQHVNSSPGIPTQAHRKRTLDARSPLREGTASLKPKIARSFASEFLPSTLAYSYNPRFPPDHRLRSDFVRTYALDGELGKGGYGFVMAATNRHDGREVAVKFIAKNKIPRFGWGKDEFGKDVPKEAVVLSKLSHPGIVEFYDLYEDEHYFYVVQELHGTPWQKHHTNPTFDQQLPANVKNVLEKQLAKNFLSSTPYIAKQLAKVDAKIRSQESAKLPQNRPSSSRRVSHDLFECIEQHKNKRMPEEDAKYIFAQVVDIVDYLDRLGFAHCDIKDENIVVDKNLKIKLIDFGSAVQADPTHPRPYYERFYGTAAYAPSEVLRKQLYQAAPAEVWSLGILLSFLRTGTSPFPTDDDRREGRVNLDEKNMVKISSECMDLIKRCLDPDPCRRANIEEVKKHPWIQSGMQRLRYERLKAVC